MSQRFFLSQPIVDGFATLEGDEAHHLVRVMRARSGYKCTLFDGTGSEYRAEVAEILPKRVRLWILDRQVVDRELPFRITIGAPLPKGDRERFLVEKLTELGVTVFVPLVTARGVVRPTAAAVRRLERAVIEASKQCGRNRLMQIAAPTALPSFLRDHATAEVRWLAHPGDSRRETTAAGHTPDASNSPPGRGGSDVAPGESLLVPRPDAARAAAVGPEGGFTPEELQAAASLGWRCVDLGPRVLRVETAAIALAVKLTSH
ncbi:MAG: 16S rRNA (uracil(1498)-N(3))-methyltransferase [Thermogutta sp.]|nr:16S rRNA (uracil(1498)-N(3))-methyltransferase [Thermogutta sp.]